MNSVEHNVPIDGVKQAGTLNQSLSASGMLGQRIAEMLKPASTPEILKLAAPDSDFSALSDEDCNAYAEALCQFLGLSTLFQPLRFVLQGDRKILYATPCCASQLRELHEVTIVGIEEFSDETTCTVRVEVQDKTGRTDFDIGSVAMPVLPLNSSDRAAKVIASSRATARMQAVEKAKMRATFSICCAELLCCPELEVEPLGTEILALIKSARTAAGIEQSELVNLIIHKYGVSHPQDLTSFQADELIKHLNARSQ